LGVGSGRVVPVPPPNYTVNLVQDSGTYIFTTNPLRHRKDVWYQLFNNGTPFAGGGVVTESFAVIQNPCGLGIATGTASLDGSGMFPDTYYNDTRMCSDGCFLTSKQTYRFDSRNIRDNRVEFFCANIKVQQW